MLKAVGIVLLTLILAGAVFAQPELEDPNEYDGLYVYNTPVISEFMASNGSSQPLDEGELLDEDGDSSDWIEIYNPTGQAVHLGGWYLTNDADNLEQWQFPAGVVLGSGQFLVVFASGKDRSAANSELHTNFRLNTDGEYLALVETNGEAIAHEYGPNYPRQLPDISYGLGQYATSLVPAGARVSYRVPTANDEGKNWTALDFDDSGWHTGQTGIGFGTTAPGFEVVYYKASTAVNNLDIAEQVIANSAYQSSVANETAPVINYLNTAGNGHFDDDNPFPSTTIGANVEDFVVLVTGKVLIPQSGDWSFGVNSDDGFGVEMTNGTNTLSFSYPDPRGTSDTIVTFNVKDYGFYDLRLVFYERGGGSALEFFAAQGRYSSFSSSRFKLVGDFANGGLYVISSSDEANTNIEQWMKNINTSLWTRIEFEGEQTNYFDSLALRMKYEDAFVAYLNGVEIVRSNFDGVPAWNSAADSDRPNGLATEFEHIDISDLAGDLREGRNVLAIHGMNDSIADGEFIILPELIAASNRMMPQYFTTATPGQFNVSGAMNLVSDTKFNYDRGFYDVPLDVEITCDTPGVTIHYTLDGSAPSETHGNQYFIPIRISTSTCLRAMAFRPGWVSTNIDTQTYVFPSQVINQPRNPAGFPGSWDYEMDPEIVNSNRNTIKNDLKSLPVMSLVMNVDDLFGSQGIYTNWNNQGQAWERPGSLELFYPDNSNGFQVNCGVRIYGGVGRREKKKTFRVLFKRQYGPTKLRYPLFGDNATDEFNTLILRANFNDAYVWGGADSQYIRDEVIRRLQLQLGGAAPYGDFVHLYVNGLYWGLYNPVERPDTAFSATYFGGDEEDWDGINSTQPTGESQRTAWNTLMSMVGQGLETAEAYQRLQGNNPDGTDNPDYEDYLDVENYITFLLANYYGGNNDWMSHNWYAGRMRGPDSTGWKAYTWDAEWIMGMRSGLNDNAVNDTTSNNYLLKPHSYLRYNSEYLMLFADTAHKAFFNGGPLYVDPSNPGWNPSYPQRNRPAALYAELADLVERAMIAESARWGDVQSSNPYNIDQWRSERDWVLNTYTRQRSSIVLDQLRNAGLYPGLDAPVFRVNGSAQHGGEIPTSHMLSMSASVGKIYYTIDGKDARLPTNPVDIVKTIDLVVEDDPKRVLVPNSDIGTNWRTDPGYNDSAWISGTGAVGYERGSGYANLISININEQMRSNNSCYVRIPFRVEAADLDGLNFMRFKIRYDDAFVAYINGREIHRAGFNGTPNWDSNSSSNHEADALESFDVSGYIDALKSGNNILAIHGLNASTNSSDFLISAELVAGQSELVNENEVLSESAIEYTGSITLTESTHIKPRVLNGSTWSALNEATFAVGPVAGNLRITEIMFNPQDTGAPDDPNTEFVELKNIGTETLNLNLVRFTNGIDFTFPSLEIAAGQYVVIVRDIEAFSEKYGNDVRVAGEYSGSLNNGGERIEIEDAAGRSIHNFRYSDNWYDITDGMDFSLTIKDPAAADPNLWDDKNGWRPSADTGGSPGWDDTGEVPSLGEVVINELLAHSHADDADWIELHNTTDTPIDIGGWFLSDSTNDLMKYEITAGTTIEPYGYIVFYEDLHFGNPDDPGSHELFALSENGETLYLHSGKDGLLTGYSDEEKFDASETGIAFGRYQKSSGTYNFVAMSVNTPGSENAYPMVGPIVINEIMYNPASGDQDAEYIELLNINDSTVLLAEYDNEFFIEVPWRFVDDNNGIVFDFPLGTTMAPGEYLLLVKDITAFNAAYRLAPRDVQIFEWGPGRLSNSGEKLQLSKPGDQVENERYYIRVDRVNYSDGFHPLGDDPWPLGPDGYGQSLNRIIPADYGNDPDNWIAENPSPGQ